MSGRALRQRCRSGASRPHSPGQAIARRRRNPAVRAVAWWFGKRATTRWGVQAEASGRKSPLRLGPFKVAVRPRWMVGIVITTINCPSSSRESKRRPATAAIQIRDAKSAKDRSLKRPAARAAMALPLRLGGGLGRRTRPNTDPGLNRKSATVPPPWASTARAEAKSPPFKRSIDTAPAAKIVSAAQDNRCSPRQATAVGELSQGLPSTKSFEVGVVVGC